jgi:hypothetical protein
MVLLLALQLFAQSLAIVFELVLEGCNMVMLVLALAIRCSCLKLILE